MSRRNGFRACLLAAAGVLAGCRTPTPPQAESAVVASVIGAAPVVAQLEGGNAAHAARNGPLFLDAASFSALDTVPLPGGGPRTKPQVRHSSRADAVKCRPFGGGCHVRDNGLFIHLDSLDVSARDAFSAVVTYTWTDTRHRRSMIGYARVGLGFRQVAGEWRLVEKRVIDIT